MGTHTSQYSRQNEELNELYSGRFLNAPDYLVAEADPNAVGRVTEIFGARQVDLFIDFLDVGLATEFHMKFRYSPLIGALRTTINDWGYVKVDSIDPLTGMSSVQDYEVIIDISAGPMRQLLRITQISGIVFSPVFWVNGNGAEGTIHCVLQGAT